MSCADVELEAGPAAAVADADDRPITDRLREWDTSKRFNDWHAREARCRSAADDGYLDNSAHDPDCPTHDGLCLDMRLRREGFIEISYHAVETPRGRPGALEDVTDTDIYTLTGQHDLTHEVMGEALRATAEFRRASLVPLSTAIDNVVELRQATYLAYRGALRSDGDSLPDDLRALVDAVTTFADPLNRPAAPATTWQARHRRWTD